MNQLPNVVLVRSAQSIRAADRLPANAGRASRIHALIDAFELDAHLRIIEPRPLSIDELAVFHSEDFIKCLFADSGCSSNGDDDDDDDDESSDQPHEDRLAKFGLVHDCALFDGVEEHVRYAAGGTVAAADALVRSQAQVAIHWEGGRHHCQRNKAAGFCYVNDVVLGIIELQKRFSRVLYIDLDLHHGDGVQDAFIYSNRVMTLSLHHYDRGFYPNTGGKVYEGRGRGKAHSINVPLQRGTSDSTFIRMFYKVAHGVLNSFDPSAVVVQCGSDGLAGDPHKVFNLTTDAFAHCIKSVISWQRPVMLLGGGGYSIPDCARCWTRLTGIACGRDIAATAQIPDHAFLNEYAPGFDMLVDAMLVEDKNTQSSTQEIWSALSLLFTKKFSF